MMRGYAKLAAAVVAVAALVAGLLQGKSRRKLIACVSALAIAVTAGVALRLTAAPTGPARVERSRRAGTRSGDCPVRRRAGRANYSA